MRDDASSGMIIMGELPESAVVDNEDIMTV
jgi:hypothetical protein